GMIASVTVFVVPSGRDSTSSPDGHAGAATRRRAYDENNGPKSMTSEARNTQMPSVTFETPVSARAVVVYGITAGPGAGNRRSRRPGGSATAPAGALR